VSDQRIFGAPQQDTAKLLQELTTVDDLFRDGGVVLTTEAEAEAGGVRREAQHPGALW
jgi:hypothetical protein